MKEQNIEDVQFEEVTLKSDIETYISETDAKDKAWAAWYEASFRHKEQTTEDHFEKWWNETK